LLNDAVVSTVPSGVLHMDSGNKTPMPAARLAVRAGDVVSIRERGGCIFVLKSMETWPLEEGYDSQKEAKYLNLSPEAEGSSVDNVQA